MTTEVIPYGYCNCGCGEKTKVAALSNKRFGHVRGQPLRFIYGHRSRNQSAQFDHRYERRPSDECWMWLGRVGWDGKGRFGNPSRLAHRVAYERFIGPLDPLDEVTRICGEELCVNPGHLALRPPLPDPPNPEGICQCGCGGKAPIAAQSDRRLGHVRGEPMRFIRGHAALRPLSPLSPHRWEEQDLGYETPCWIWKRYILNGYGRVSYGGKNVQAHRATYQAAGGTIPTGFHVHHKCEQTACVNPEHLVALSVRQHARLTRHS